MNPARSLGSAVSSPAGSGTEPIDFYAIIDLKMASDGNDVVSYYVLFICLQNIYNFAAGIRHVKMR